MQLDRRQALHLGSRLAAGAAFAHAFAGRALAAEELRALPGAVLALPAGFQAQILGPTSGAPDGMACFLRADGNLALMRNQELPAPLGGVMRLVLEPKTLAVLYRDVVLSGTERNCAGGVSPWGWLSCEETFRSGHGYVYLCDHETGKASGPIRGYGHFNHEAAVVCPRTLICYLTEDRGDGCFYRFVPRSLDTPFEGMLQALAAPRMPAVGKAVPAGWVSAGEPDPREDTVRFTARSAGAMAFSRGEGLWQHDDLFYFTATSGGSLGLGQIFCYDAAAETLTLIAESRGADDLDMPDNLTVAPWGDLFVAEDGGGEQCLRLVRPDGTRKTFARNVRSGSELAGVCFAPDGETMFVNVQGDGLTLAIRGPFRAWA